MHLQEIIKVFDETSEIGPEAISEFQTIDELRGDLIEYFRSNENRKFALGLLNEFSKLRRSENGIVSIEDLMLACYVLGQHNHVEDSLEIWNVKCIDFDTYCGVDVQLVVFAGVDKTIDYFKTAGYPETDKASEYISKCNNCGDFDNLDEYFSHNQLPWFV
jgi:hypothetical protein